MKMKEICERTGLTERAVRLYCQRGLLSPETYTQRDRDYLVFNEEDERALRCIAVLRQADFSLEEIAVMQNEPHLIEKTVREHTVRLMQESAEKLELLTRLQALDHEKLSDIVSLADQLGRGEPRSNVSPLKGQTFAEFCEQGGYCEDESLFVQEERLIRRGRIFSRWYLAAYVVSLFMSVLTIDSLFSFVVGTALDILFVVFFFKGHVWARVVKAVLQALGVLTGFATFMGVINLDAPFWLPFLLLPFILMSAVIFYFLAFDNGVSAWQYEKRTGGDRYL